MKDNDSLYFPNLQALRFIAASIVIVHHIEQFRVIFHLTNYSSPPVVRLGGLGVNLFFVLSGFLITQLLLREESLQGRISIGNFYIRRILRIWPLYYLIVILAFFVLPHFSFFEIPKYSFRLIDEDTIAKLSLFVLMLPNLAMAVYGALPFVSHTWSIGTEEQFYLLWPLLLRSFKRRYLLLMSIIFLYLIIRAGVHFGLQGHFARILDRYLDEFQIDCMAIGGLFSLIAIDRPARLVKFVFHPATQIFTMVTTVVCLIGGIKFSPLTSEIYAVLFGIIIINLACNPNPVVSMENKITRYVGNISYGLYMYHPLIIVACIRLLPHGGWLNSLLLYISCFTGTILLASASYQLIERPFLLKKKKFTRLATLLPP